MKKLLFTASLIFISLVVDAQNTDDISYFQEIWGMEKRAIVEQYMNLPPEVEGIFWGDYEEYEAQRRELGRERIMIISDYVDNFLTLTDDTATKLMNAAIKNNIAYQKLAQKTFKKMSKSITAVKAAQFIQLENYFMITIQMNIQENLPFIGELDEMMEE